MPDEVTGGSGRTSAHFAGRSGRRATSTVAAVLGGVLASGCAVFGSAADPAAPSGPASTHSGAQPSKSGSSKPGRSTPPVRHVKVLAGKVVGIDPGHNGLNNANPSYINQIIWNGRQHETCDTTGTETNAGYTEALFNFNVATYLRSYLRADGARVVMTRPNNHGVGPCVDKRSQIINAAHANVAIDIHADGSLTAGARGFTVLEPIADGPNDQVISSSLRFGSYVHGAFLAKTPLGISNYYGQNGYILRDDLAGLNLTTVPKVLIECGNMRDAADAALLTSPRVQQEIARALEAAIIRFLTGKWPPKTTAG